MGLIISKEQKTSEFRQQWIDALRQEVAEFLGYAEITATLRSMLDLDECEPAKEKTKIAEGLLRIKDEARESERLYHQLLLKLNPNEHCNIVQVLNELRDEINKEAPASSFARDQIEQRLITQVQEALRAEWNRVKRGELVYRIAKFGTMVVVVMLVILLSVSLISKAKLLNQTAVPSTEMKSESSNNALNTDAPQNRAPVSAIVIRFGKVRGDSSRRRKRLGRGACVERICLWNSGRGEPCQCAANSGSAYRFIGG